MGKCYLFKQLLNNTKVKLKSRAGSLKFVSPFFRKFIQKSVSLRLNTGYYVEFVKKPVK